MKMIETFNLDGVKVGWYQISYFNDHFNFSSFLTQHDYQSNYKHAIFLVYDLFEVKKGGDTPFKAFRISEKFYNLCSSESKNIGFDKFFFSLMLESKILIQNMINYLQKFQLSLNQLLYRMHLCRNIDQNSKSNINKIIIFNSIP